MVKMLQTLFSQEVEIISGYETAVWQNFKPSSRNSWHLWECNVFLSSLLPGIIVRHQPSYYTNTDRVCYPNPWCQRCLQETKTWCMENKWPLTLQKAIQSDARRNKLYLTLQQTIKPDAGRDIMPDFTSWSGNVCLLTFPFFTMTNMKHMIILFSEGVWSHKELWQ